MIRQTIAVIGAAAMFGATSLALANDNPTPDPAPTTAEAPKPLDARMNEAERQPAGGTPEPAKQ